MSIHLNSTKFKKKKKQTPTNQLTYFFLLNCCNTKYYNYVCNFIYSQTLYITNVRRRIRLVTKIALLNNFRNER